MMSAERQALIAGLTPDRMKDVTEEARRKIGEAFDAVELKPNIGWVAPALTEEEATALSGLVSWFHVLGTPDITKYEACIGRNGRLVFLLPGTTLKD